MYAGRRRTGPNTNAEHASEELGDSVILSGGAEIEHDEIAVYETLIALAEALDNPRVVEALRANLDQEEHQLSSVSDAFEKASRALRWKAPRKTA